ncbi:MAG: formate/nitrite transporter family protein [Chitinivibrionia bacterium]|nr:formate/nitrite transporter family protein [Chitinivibrionia bacterium]
MDVKLDALIPAEMAAKGETVGVNKAHMSVEKTFALAILAGAFIGLGAIFATTVLAGTGGMLPFGVQRLLAGLVFTLGLILVIVGGAELFTGNNLITMAWANNKVGTGLMVKNWIIVWIGNLVGSLLTVVIMYFGAQYMFGNGAIGATALAIANGKVQLGFVFWTLIKKTPADFPALTWGSFFVNNLIPVTIGNIIGGGVMVGLAYWFIYLRDKK